MDREHLLLPLSFDISKAGDKSVPLSTLPRAREERDRNAGGTLFHTRGSDAKRKQVHDQSPEKGSSRKSRKRLDTSDMLTSDDFTAEDHVSPFPGTSTQKQLRSSFLSSSDFNTYPSSESIVPHGRMPSSPPILNRPEDDDDFNPMADKSFILPSSPQRVDQFDEFQVPSMPSLSQNTLTNNRSSSNPFFKTKSHEDFDFGIDKFNRVQGVHSDQPSSELGDDPQMSQKTLHECGEVRAREIITQCFEDQKTEIHLDSLDLGHIPEEIEDLKDLVTFDSDNCISKPKLQIYITHNKVRSLTPRLFELKEMVEVLSVRSNKLKSIPGAIAKFSELNYLNVVSNSIQLLPAQILQLHKLQKLLLRPNVALLECDKFTHVRQLPDPVHKGNKCKRSVGRLRLVNRHEHSINPLSIKMSRNLSILSQVSESDQNVSLALSLGLDNFDEEEQHLLQQRLSSVPRLSELCLRKFAAYKTSKSETKKWSRSVGFSTSKLIAKAFHLGLYGETCSVCGQTVIQYVAEVLEWWDILDTKLVPVRKQFCCGGCVRLWQSENTF